MCFSCAGPPVWGETYDSRSGTVAHLMNNVAMVTVWPPKQGRDCTTHPRNRKLEKHNVPFLDGSMEGDRIVQ